MDQTMSPETGHKDLGIPIWLHLLLAISSCLIALAALLAIPFSVMFIVDGQYGDGSRPGKRTEAQTREHGKTLLPISWTIVPVSVAIFIFLLPESDPTQPFMYDLFLPCFIDVFKGWLLLTADVAFVVWVGQGVRRSTAVIQHLVDEEMKDCNGRPDGDNTQYLSRRIFHKLLAVAPLLFVITSSVVLGWTALNIIYYAAEIGFFTGQGGFCIFFECYIYTLLTAVEYLILPTSATGGTVALFLGFLITIGLFASIGGYIFNFRAALRGQKEEETVNPVWFMFRGFYCWCAGCGLFYTWSYWSDCKDSQNALRRAITLLYIPGAEDQTLTWAVVSNITGTYNVTTEPYRPPPAKSGLRPLNVEFQCLGIGLYQALWFVTLSVCGAAVSSGLSWGWAYWSKRTAVQKGQAYELLANNQ